MKKDLATVELHHLVRELQPLTGRRVEHVYQAGQELVISLHQTGAGKSFLRLTPAFAWLSDRKPDIPGTPPEFCMQVRRRLDGLKVAAIRQVGGERIIELVFQGKEGQYLLLVELFSGGNIILCDAAHVILAARVMRKYAGRSILPRQHYAAPPGRPHLAGASERQFLEFMKDAKDNVSRTLATGLGLGGTYAAEACLRAGIDPKALRPSEAELRRLHAAVQELFTAAPEPVAYLKDGACIDITPFTLQQYVHLKEERFPAFSAALDAHLGTGLGEERKRQAEERFQRRREKLETALHLQERRLVQAEREAVGLQRKGEWLYERYQDVQPLLAKAALLRKQGPEAFRKLLEEPGVVEIDEGKGTFKMDTEGLKPAAER
jgi:predicted ribosome quality control (RQC) complex YloA/Tae2 family protein